MRTHFDKIEAWLEENADRILRFSLRPPASESQLEELESTIGKALPEGFKQLYRWHDGLRDDENFGSLFFGMDFYPIGRLLEDFGKWNRNEDSSAASIELSDADEAIDSAHPYSPAWIKFAFDGAHTGLYLDLAPSNTGTYGQIIFIDDELGKGILVAESTEELVSDFASDLEHGRYGLDPDALDDGEHYIVADSSISIVNWYNSERWRK